MGAAHIPSYVSYTSTIPPLINGGATATTAAAAVNNKVGVTLSRIDLGMYVEAVSTAACLAGVQPGSILVDMNGMGMLGEPFRQGLERLEQYEATLHLPVRMLFYKQGRGLYQVLFLYKPPFGITWAPCGQFALVQRAYALAADAGVQRGCLVAAANGKTMRTMDHEATAAHLRELFVAGQPMELTLAYTPAASRTAHFDKMRPVDYKDARDQPTEPYACSMGSIFNCGTGSTTFLNMTAQSATVYSPCPVLEEWLTTWDLLESLVFMLQAAKCGYDEDAMSQLIIQSRQDTIMATLKSMMHAEDSWRIADSLLLQWVSILCKPDEKDDIDLSSILMVLSRKNDAFCHRLYFLLRSFTATLEGHRSRQDDNTRHLLTLLQALDRLRFAQKQLSSQLTSSVVEVASPTNAFDSALLNTHPAHEAALPPQKPKKFRMFKKKNKKGGFEGSPPMIQSLPKGTSLKQLSTEMESLSVPFLLENMSRFLTDLDGICDDIERSLLKSFSKKIADWALQPWSVTKETALAKVTEGMRAGLSRATADGLPLVNPLDASEVLMSLKTTDCFILPSAHFPLLLTFDVKNNESALTKAKNDEQVYRTRVQVVALRGAGSTTTRRVYVVEAAVGGVVRESGRSTGLLAESHTWEDIGGTLTFDTRSSWGAPKTLCLRLSSVALDAEGRDQVSHTDDNGRLMYSSEEGYCWVDMTTIWKRGNSPTVSCHAQVWSLETTEAFDQHGDLLERLSPWPERLELELQITTEIIEFTDSLCPSRMLLYKHDDDVRQEMFALQFIEICDLLLKASGLDLKLLTFRCIAVGAKRGFIEWVSGSVPLSDICRPLSTHTKRVNGDVEKMDRPDDGTPSEVAQAGLMKFQSLYPAESTRKRGERNTLVNNPIQDFLRSVAYNGDDPYLIAREVMDTYVKSCAGYCVLTYILGVGDRHLDNLLLNQSGHFFHCDYSFILGNDPKKYLPMRITEDMVNGMGGPESDNYAKFLSLAGVVFVTLRRHGNVRVLLSLVRLMVPSALPDVSFSQNADQVLQALRDRLRLDLSDTDAIAYMERLIENSIASKMWLAVDAIHRLGKRF